jgi:hypothetical protein
VRYIDFAYTLEGDSAFWAIWLVAHLRESLQYSPPAKLIYLPILLHLETSKFFLLNEAVCISAKHNESHKFLFSSVLMFSLELLLVRLPATITGVEIQIKNIFFVFCNSWFAWYGCFDLLWYTIIYLQCRCMNSVRNIHLDASRLCEYLH